MVGFIRELLKEEWTDKERSYNKRFMRVIREVIFLFICFWPAWAVAQESPFSADTIPVRNGKVVFQMDFQHELTPEESNARINFLLSRQLNPVSGKIIENSPEYTACQIVDYIEVGENILHSYGIYMLYDMRFDYEQDFCQMTIDHIRFMEKGYIDAYLDPADKRSLPMHDAVEIMVERDFKQLFVKDASGQITTRVIERINGVVHAVDVLFEPVDQNVD